MGGLDLIAFQRPDVVPADVVPVRAPGVELVLAPVGREPVLEPFKHSLRQRAVGQQIGDDALQQVEEGPVVFGRPGQRRALAFYVADDHHAQAVEGPNRHAVRRWRAEARADRLLHLVPCIPSEG